MNENTRQQASHFDQNTPITPWPGVLRREGFGFHYIAKDLLIKRAVDQVGLKSESRVLDVGCGIGVWLDRIESSYGSMGFGVDVSRGSLRVAINEKVGRSSFMLADAGALPFETAAFDLVLSLDTLEHIEDPARILNEMVRVASNRGSVLVYAVSSRNRYTLGWFQHKLLALVGIDMLAISSHRPDLLVDPNTVDDLFKSRALGSWRFEYFHAFFSSAFDQVLLVTYLILKKLGMFSRAIETQDALGKTVLALTTKLSRLLLDTLLRVDRPWTRNQISNGFLVHATKKVR